MALIHYWPFESNTRDSVGDGSDAGGSISMVAGSPARGGACQVNFPKLDSDFTISFDIYRGGYTADWCTDFGTGAVDWGIGVSDDGYNLRYNQNYGYPNLCIVSKIDSSLYPIFKDTKETIGVWYHAEIHRHGNTHFCFINEKLKREWEDDVVSYPDHCYFSNAGMCQTGGSSVKELKIYNTAFVESLGDRHSIYNYLESVYAIPIPPEK